MPLQPGPVSGHVPALDGLRAIAVVAVVAAHAVDELAALGIGVDMFFVISGFLITSILMTELASSDQLNLRRFYRRRMARLYPALALVVVVTAAIYTATNLDFRRETLLGSAASLLYVSAVPRMFDQSLGWLSHTWSLSVEEAFYLVWPIVLLIGHRLGSSVRRVVMYSLLAAAAWHVVLSFIASDAWLYNGPDSRAIQLLAGAGLATVLDRDRTPTFAVRAGSVAGASLLIVMVTGIIDAGLQVELVLVAVASVLIISWAHAAPDCRVLSEPVLQWIGTRSYGIYLIHMPLFGLHVDSWPRSTKIASRFVALAATFGLAGLLYSRWEAPLRARFSEPAQGRLSNGRSPDSAEPPSTVSGAVESERKPNEARRWISRVRPSAAK